MEEKEKIATMIELKNMRNAELSEQNELEEKEAKVLNVKYLGKINWNQDDQDIEKEIYLLIEQVKDKEGNIIEIERYYTEDGQLIGGNNKSDQYNYIILNEELSDNQELAEKLQKLDKEGILDLEKIDKQIIEEISRENKTKETDKDNKKNKDEEDEEQEKSEKDKEDEEDELDQNEITSQNGISYIDINQKVTDNETIASLLKVQDKGYSKIAIVHSNEVEGNDSTTRFSFVGVKPDGTYEKINTLKQRYGNKPTKNITTINRDGSNVEEKQVQSIYQIEGEDENQLAVRVGSLGTIETYLVRTPRENNQEAISIPIETTSTLNKTTKEPMRLMNRNRNYKVKEEIERAKEHKNCKEKTTIRDIDDDPTNDTHEIIDEQYIEHCVDEIMKDSSIEEVFTRGEVEERLRKGIQNKEPEKTLSETIDDIKLNLSEDAEHFKKHEI